MNERIKELAEQSGFPDWWLFPPEPERQNGESQKMIEKFAELIIKDCASICELNGESYKHSFTPVKAKLAESTSKYCGYLIKQHFGIK